MTALVRILPSGHQFVLQGHATLLEAGLSAGLALEYGCSNGNCGQCLARVKSGDVRKIRQHDYRISAARKISGHVLMCCNTAVNEVVLEAHEANSADEIQQQQITARIRNIECVADRVTLLHLKTPRTRRLRFLAGQYVALGGNGLPVAEHSIGSCPCDDMNVHFQIPWRMGDAFSETVCQTLKYGDPVDITGPMGDFVLDEDSLRGLVFIAWQTGFAPIRSLIEHAMALETADTIQLLWISNQAIDRYLENLCRSWHDALDDFNYVPVDAGNAAGRVELKHLFTEKLNIDPHGPAAFDFYIAGNEWLVNQSRSLLINNGVPAAQIKTDPLMHD